MSLMLGNPTTSNRSPAEPVSSGTTETRVCERDQGPWGPHLRAQLRQGGVTLGKPPPFLSLIFPVCKMGIIPPTSPRAEREDKMTEHRPQPGTRQVHARRPMNVE